MSQSNLLVTFRQDVYASFRTAADALMNTCDALLTHTEARCLAQLSWSPCFDRRWPSLYAALQDGQIDRAALQAAFARAAPAPGVGQRRVLGIDSSPILRPLSHTAPDRTYVHAPDAPPRRARAGRSGAASPMRVGWQFAALALLPETPSSWTYLLDNQRIASTTTAAAVAAAQLAAVVPLLSTAPTAPTAPTASTASTAPALRPVVVGDRYYGSATFVDQTQDTDCDKLLRVQSHRVFFHAAPAPTGRRGAPRKDGARFKCSDPATHSQPDQEWSGTDANGRPVTVTAWHGLHFRACRDVPLSVLRVMRPQAANTKRDPRQSWFIWVSPVNVPDPLPPVAQIPRLYRLRFSLEHGFRFDKQNLLWSQPRLRQPDQYQCWTDVVAVARNQLVLAQPLVQAQRQPWERTPTVSRTTTPQQVRRGVGRIIAQLGTPARPCQPRGKSPGRAPGAVVRRAPPSPVVYKSA